MALSPAQREQIYDVIQLSRAQIKERSTQLREAYLHPALGFFDVLTLRNLETQLELIEIGMVDAFADYANNELSDDIFQTKLDLHFRNLRFLMLTVDDALVQVVSAIAIHNARA